jgi:hypothetical protein
MQSMINVIDCWTVKIWPLADVYKHFDSAPFAIMGGWGR